MAGFMDMLKMDPLLAMRAGAGDTGVADAFAMKGPPPTGGVSGLGALMQPTGKVAGALTTPATPAPAAVNPGIGQQIAAAAKTQAAGAEQNPAEAGGVQALVDSLSGIQAPEEAPPPSAVAPRGGSQFNPSQLMQMLMGGGGLGGLGQPAPNAMPSLAALMSGRR